MVIAHLLELSLGQISGGHRGNGGRREDNIPLHQPGCTPSDLRTASGLNFSLEKAIYYQLATNLVPNDTNMNHEVFVETLATAQPDNLISEGTSIEGARGNDASNTSRAVQKLTHTSKKAKKAVRRGGRRKVIWLRKSNSAPLTSTSTLDTTAKDVAIFQIRHHSYFSLTTRKLLPIFAMGEEFCFCNQPLDQLPALHIEILRHRLGAKLGVIRCAQFDTEMMQFVSCLANLLPLKVPA